MNLETAITRSKIQMQRYDRECPRVFEAFSPESGVAEMFGNRQWLRESREVRVFMEAWVAVTDNDLQHGQVVFDHSLGVINFSFRRLRFTPKCFMLDDGQTFEAEIAPVLLRLPRGLEMMWAKCRALSRAA